MVTGSDAGGAPAVAEEKKFVTLEGRGVEAMSRRARPWQGVIEAWDRGDRGLSWDGAEG